MNEQDVLAEKNSILESIFVRTAGEFLSGDSLDPYLSLSIKLWIAFSGDLNCERCYVSSAHRNLGAAGDKNKKATAKQLIIWERLDKGPGVYILRI